MGCLSRDQLLILVSYSHLRSVVAVILAESACRGLIRQTISSGAISDGTNANALAPFLIHCCSHSMLALPAGNAFQPGNEKKGVRSFIIIFSQDIGWACPFRLEFARVGLHYMSINRTAKWA